MTSTSYFSRFGVLRYEFISVKVNVDAVLEHRIVE